MLMMSLVYPLILEVGKLEEFRRVMRKHVDVGDLILGLVGDACARCARPLVHDRVVLLVNFYVVEKV